MDGRNAYNLIALRRAARTLSTDLSEVSSLMADVASRLDSGQAGLEASGDIAYARTLAGAYWSLRHVVQALPWLEAEALLLASALPNTLAGQRALLPPGHSWQELSHPSPLRLDEDLFDAQFGN
jgi:hypothetical protein